MMNLDFFWSNPRFLTFVLASSLIREEIMMNLDDFLGAKTPGPKKTLLVPDTLNTTGAASVSVGEPVQLGATAQ